MCIRDREKYKALEENEVRYEEIGCDDADYVIVAFGSSARICSATVEMARAEGLKVGLLRPITLYPFPKKPLAELAARGVKGFLSAELNAGQMVEDVRPVSYTHLTRRRPPCCTTRATATRCSAVRSTSRIAR